MIMRSWACARRSLVLLACASAQAGAGHGATYGSRAASSTIFEGPVTTDGKRSPRATARMPCDGTNRGRIRPRADDDVRTRRRRCSPAASVGGHVVFVRRLRRRQDRPGRERPRATVLGICAELRRHSEVGGCQQQVATGDEVLYAFDFFDKATLELAERPRGSRSGEQPTGQPVRCADESPPPATGQPRDCGRDRLPGRPRRRRTDQAARVGFDSPGCKQLKAERAGLAPLERGPSASRDTGTGDCGVPPGQLGSTAGPGQVTRPRAPVARISGPRTDARYGRGPRLLQRHGRRGPERRTRGQARVAPARAREAMPVVERAAREVRRHELPRSSSSSRSARTATGRTCCRARCRPGRYVLDVKAFDGAPQPRREVRARHEPERVRRRRPASRGARPAAARARAARAGDGRGQASSDGRRGRHLAGAPDGGAGIGARVQGRRLDAARRAGGRARQAAHRARTCATSALRAAQRGAAPGSCSCDRIGSERNRGQDGWVYKVNDFAPAAWGRGRPPLAGLRAGDRVLWFYCVLRRRRAQLPALAARHPRTAARPGRRARCGCRWRAMTTSATCGLSPGATVTLGPATRRPTPRRACATLVRPARGHVRARRARRRARSRPSR